MNIIKNIIFWTWQLPQSLLGAIIYLILKVSRSKLVEVDVDSEWVGKAYLTKRLGVSLGYYIFYKRRDKKHIRHELGHLRQSYYLGWFYLLVIGIPSLIINIILIIRNIIGMDKKETLKMYYSFYTEAWADSLGKKYYR